MNDRLFLEAELLRVDSNVLAQCNCAVAGGAVRDVMHGKNFVDVDIAFWNMEPHQFHTAFQMYVNRSPYLIQLGDPTGDASLDGDDSRLLKVIQFRLLGTPVGDVDCDWLLYGKKFHTLKDVLDSHDHSVSQYGMWYDENFVVHAEYFGEEVGHCYRLRDDLSQDRVNRVRDICTELSWVYHG